MKNKKNIQLRIVEGKPTSSSRLSVLINNKIISGIIELFFLILGTYGIIAELKQGYFEDLELEECLFKAIVIIVILFTVRSINKVAVYVISVLMAFLYIGNNYAELSKALITAYYSIARWIYWYIAEGNLVVPNIYKYISYEILELGVLEVTFPWILLNVLSWKRKGGFYGSVFALSLYMTIFFSSGFMPDFIPMLCMLASVCALAFRFFGVNKEAKTNNNVQLLMYLVVGYIALVISMSSIGRVKSLIIPAQDYIYNHYTLDKVLIDEDGDSKDNEKDKDKDRDDKKQAEGGISGGKTGKGNKEFKPKGSDTLKVKFTNRINHSVYLRGYAADTYTGDGWVNTVSPYYTFYYCNSPYQVMTNEYRILSQVLGNIQFGSTEAKDGEVGNLGASKLLQNLNILDMSVQGISKDVGKSGYVITPYAGIVSREDGVIEDGFYLRRDEGQSLENFYTFCDFTGGYDPADDNSLYGLLCSGDFDILSELDDFSRARVNELYDFAVNNYLEVPEYLSDIYDKYKNHNYSNLREAALFVQNELRDGFTYSTKPKPTPEGEDFIHYFMFDSKEGYCMYYASAAVMIFRSMGIPARYVEGYLLSRAASNINIHVKDSNAHAWVEIFVPGYGWAPIEVTNGRLTANGYVPNETESKPDEAKTTTEAVKKTTEAGSTSSTKESDEVTNPEDNPSKGVGKALLIILAIILVPLLILFIIMYVYSWVFIKEKNLSYRKRLHRIYKRVYHMTKNSETPFTAEDDAGVIATAWKLNEKTVISFQESLQAAEFGNRMQTLEECRLAEKIEKQIMRRRRDTAGGVLRLYYNWLLRVRRK